MTVRHRARARRRRAEREQTGLRSQMPSNPPPLLQAAHRLLHLCARAREGDAQGAGSPCAVEVDARRRRHAGFPKHATAEVAAVVGEVRDVGTLAAINAASVAVEIRVMSGNQHLGMHDLFGEMREPLWARMVMMTYEQLPREADLNIVFDLEVGRKCYLNGLAPGRWQFRSLVDPAWPAPA